MGVRLRFGIHTGQQDTSFDELRRVWRLADRSGFVWISVWDHFYETPARDGSTPSFEGIASMAALASETKNVRVGCLVFCIAYRNPAALAKAAVTIDHISGGRCNLGIGAGWHRMEFEELGYSFGDPKTRSDMLEEGIQIIQGMLGPEEATTFAGEHFHVRNARCLPRPVQDKLPVWVGGTGVQRTLRTTARHADGWNSAYIPPELFKRRSETLDEWCGKEGRDPSTIARSINLGFYMGADEAAAQRYREQFPAVWGEGDPRSRGMLFGTAGEVVERIGEYADAGAEHINLAFRPPIDFDAFQAFIEDVMPKFS